MKFKLSAAFLAAAFCLLLSAPIVSGQGTEAPPTDEGAAAGIVTGTPVPDATVSPAPAHAQLSAEEAERQAQAEFRRRLRGEASGLQAAWGQWAKELRAPQAQTRTRRPTTRPAPTPSLTAGQVEDIVKNLLDDFRKGLPNETALRGIVQEEIVQALGEYPTRQELEGCLAQVKKTIEKNGKATRLAIRETNGRALPFCLLIAVVVFAVIGLGATISGRRRKL